jgi:hypothetical protein
VKPPRIRLVPAEAACGVRIEPAVIADASLRLPLLRRVPQLFGVSCANPGTYYWFVGLLNEHMAPEHRQDYVYFPPKKSKLPPLTSEEIAVRASHQLNECRGLVSLQEFRDGFCEFAALFAANSLWTFCLWGTDAARCPPRKPWPDGWGPGLPFPEGLARGAGVCHHEECRRDPAGFSKTAQKLLP